MNSTQPAYEITSNSTMDNGVRETHHLSPVTCCPITGQRVKSEYSLEPIPIPNGWGVWWHCSECEGWHFLIEELDMILS